MALSPERRKMLADYLTENEERTLELFNAKPETVLAKINADGYDFTAEELTEYLEYVQDVLGADELDEDALEDVSGGARSNQDKSFWYKLGYKTGTVILTILGNIVKALANG